jgi:hypothetical protein
MTPSLDPPPGLIPVPLKGAVLLLTAPEFAAGIRRGKAWRRRAALTRRLAGKPAALAGPESTIPPDPSKVAAPAVPEQRGPAPAV